MTADAPATAGAPGTPPAVAVPPTARPGRYGRERLAAVDAVRGLALLGSAVATALAWLGGRTLTTGYRPVDGSGADRAVDVVTGLLVDNRVLMVFALLLGHGVAARMLRPTTGARGRSPDAAEWADGLGRSGTLLGLGALHAALVLDADVLGTLGVLLLVAVPLARARTAVHVLVVLVALPPLVLHGALDGFGGSIGFPDPPGDYLLSVVDRVGSWLFALVLLLPVQGGLLVAVVAGVRLARGGWAADPRAHRRGLLAVGAAGVLVAAAVAVPYVRVLGAGGTPEVGVALWSGVADAVAGPAGALGAVCLGLLVLAPRSPVAGGAQQVGAVGTGPAPTAGERARDALVVLGRHSLPAYLAHSVVLALVLAPWAGGAGARWGSAAVTALGVAVWAATLVAFVVVFKARDGGAAAVVARAPGGSGATVGRGTEDGGGTEGGGGQPSERQGRDRSSAT
ncbi:DUF418 domain-containing protein [Aquipuribacter hungaricus]|uniref:DUF418 domain-containing protein n=1 Tax=Aquipuribacter hungaricus TaxID=545624 RepID=UPI00360EA55B